MFRRVILWSLVFLAVTVAFGAYHAQWLQTEWSILRGRQAFQQGDFQKAVNYLTSAVDRPEGFNLACWDRPNCSTYLRRVLAQSHLALRQDDDALRHYRKLKESKAHFLQGLGALKAGNGEESIDHFKVAIQLEGDCVLCRDALENAEKVLAARVSGNKAREVQTKALAGMLEPIKCLCSVAGITAISAGASTVLNPQLVNLVRKAGITKRVAEKAVNELERGLARILFNVTISDMCPPPSEIESLKSIMENESIKWIVGWAEFAPFSDDVRRARVAGNQAAALVGLIYQYGEAFVAEHKSNQLAASAETARAAYWDILVAASKDPAFIDRDLKSLATPAARPARGWMERTLDAINPVNWFSK